MAINISLDNSTFTLNSYILTGFSNESDALSIPDILLANVVRGSDGDMTATNTGVRGGPVGIKLLATSEGNKYLNNLAEQQSNGSSIVYDGTFVNHTSGSSITFTTGILTNYRPYPSMGGGELSSVPYIIEFKIVSGNLTSADFSI